MKMTVTHTEATTVHLDQQIDETKQRLKGINEEQESISAQIDTARDKLTALQILARDLVKEKMARQEELIGLYNQTKIR